MNILRFQTNVPNEVSLESPQGVVVQGRYGDRMMFNLTDGQVMYVPPIVANKIEAEGIGPGEPLELCKSQVKTGQRRSIEWSVRRCFKCHQTPPNAANFGLLVAFHSNILFQRERSRLVCACILACFFPPRDPGTAVR